MLDTKTLRLVLLVSCGHALVHIYELSFSSVEQLVAADFAVGKAVTGALGTTMRMPFGFGALAAGWLAGHYGAKRLLLIYLAGCSLAAGMAYAVPAQNLALMFVAMFTLGCFASIYHPAGLGFISQYTTAENRTMALGWHGIFGSAGIASAPFIVALVLSTGATWQQCYLLLALPGVVLGVLFVLWLPGHQESIQAAESSARSGDGEDNAQWRSYVTLLAAAAAGGFVYAAVLTFLPRYLGEAGLELRSAQKVAQDNYLTGMVLAIGIVGQYAAGRIARPHTLEPLLALSFAGVAVSLFWMGLAQGSMRLAAAGTFTLLFFGHQPLFNSLVAKYVPRRKRSAAYGVSFTVGFGVGSLGPAFSGLMGSDFQNYTVLAGLASVAAILATVLWRWNRR